jgi:hypothetical protein|tara:strand:+ start:388 stop:1440 length:1053 start_codon:yes stop_codon:yes gene_type:complete
MKYIKLFEKFTKEYQTQIELKDFKKIKKGSMIQYMGGAVEVLDNNGYVLKLKDDDGKIFTVNKSQFDHGGRISEVSDGKKKEKEEEFHTDVMYEAKNTIGLAFKEEQDYLDFKEFVAEQPRGAIRKNIGFDSKTKSWNVEMDVKVLDSIYGEGTPSNKKSGWYGGLPDDFESVIIESVNEAKDNLYLQLHKKYAEQIKGLKAKKIKKLTDLVSVQRRSMEDREDYFDMDPKKKKELTAEYAEERKLFKKYMGRDYSVMLPKGTESLRESSAKDGGDKSNGNSHHDDHTDNTVAQHWKDIYGEEFHSKYPAVAKIVKQRNIKDKRELKRIWDETYGENFEEQYPALYNKLD